MSIVDALTVDRWIAVLSSLGTLAAAIIAALSIRELRLQRSQQFQPRITPTTATYVQNIRPDDLLDFDGKGGKHLPVINVGHGIASDLVVSWEIDLQQWIDKVNTLSAQRGAGVGVQRDGFGLALFHNGQLKGGARLPADEGNLIPYVVPVTADREPTKAPVPGAIVALLNAYYWSYFRGLGSVEGVYRNPAPEFHVNLVLSYKDTVGRAYDRRSVLRASGLLEGELKQPDKPIQVRFAIMPVSNEPAEGYSTVTKILLRALQESVSKVVVGS